MTDHYRFQTKSGRIILLAHEHTLMRVTTGLDAFGSSASLEARLADDHLGRGALYRARDHAWPRGSGEVFMVDLGGPKHVGNPFLREAPLDWDSLPMLSDISRDRERQERERDDQARNGSKPALPDGARPLPGIEPTDGTVVEPTVDAVVFTCDRFALESAMVSPGFPKLPDGQRKAATGIGELSEMFRYLRDHADHRVIVVGHADESGKASFNDVLSMQRAACVAALLRGRRDDFLLVTDAAAELVDLKHALAWAQRRFGWPCDTGELSNIFGPRTKQALPEFRTGATLLLHPEDETPSRAAVEGAPRREDWGLVFDLICFAIAEDLDCSTDELAQVGAQIDSQIATVAAAGEQWPHRTLTHFALPDARERRVEVLVFRPGVELPVLAHPGHADEIYAPDARVSLRFLPLAVRTFVVLTLAERAGDACPAVTFEWRSERGTVRRGTTDVSGRAHLDDVPVGPFTVSCIHELDVRAKIWAQRLVRAVDASDLAALVRVLRQPSRLVRALLDAYDGPIRGTGSGSGLSDVRAMVASTPAAQTIELLLTRAGIPSPILFRFLEAEESR